MTITVIAFSFVFVSCKGFTRHKYKRTPFSRRNTKKLRTNMYYGKGLNKQYRIFISTGQKFYFREKSKKIEASAQNCKQ